MESLETCGTVTPPPLMHPIRGRKIGGQANQSRTLLLEGLRRNPSGLGHRPLFQAYRGPLQGLLVQVFQTGEMAPGKKFVSTVQKLRSSPALRLACPFS
jgi:hypothetical protein